MLQCSSLIKKLFDKPPNTYTALPIMNSITNKLLYMLFYGVLVSVTGSGYYFGCTNIWSITEQYSKIVRIVLIILFSIFMGGGYLFFNLFILDSMDRYSSLVEQKSPCIYIEGDQTLNPEEFLKKQLFFNKNQRQEIINLAKEFIIKKNAGIHSNIIFSGSPGLGKTEVAKMICQIAGGGYIIRLSDFIVQKNAKELLKLINKIKNKVIVFDDGDIGLIDRVALRSSDTTDNKDEIHENVKIVVNILLSLISINRHSIIFTVNLPKVADYAYARRFQNHYNFIHPDEKQLIGIYKNKLRRSFINCPKSSAVAILSKYSVGLSGRDISHICRTISTISNKIIPIENAISIIEQYQQKNQNRYKGLTIKRHEDFIKRLNHQVV